MGRILSALLLAVSIIAAAPAVADNAAVKSTGVVVKAQPVAPIKPAAPVAIVNPAAAAPAVASAVSPNANKSGGPSISAPLRKMLGALPLADAYHARWRRQIVPTQHWSA